MGKCLNSDRLRKFRPEWQQWVLAAAQEAVNGRNQNMEVEEPLAIRNDTIDDMINRSKNCENDSNTDTNYSQEIKWG